MDDPDYNDPRRGPSGSDEDEPAGPGPESDVEDEEDLGIFGEDGAMNPDHPLMKRAQDALKAQLEESRQKLVEQLREKAEELKVSRPSGRRRVFASRSFLRSEAACRALAPVISLSNALRGTLREDVLNTKRGTPSSPRQGRDIRRGPACGVTR